MRGENEIQSGMFSYFSPEQRVPAQHPLRTIKAHADAALSELSPIFDSMYSKMGRPSIPPERLLVFEVREGWGPLCKFLGVPVPADPFPRVNERENFPKPKPA